MKTLIILFGILSCQTLMAWGGMMGGQLPASSTTLTGDVTGTGTGSFATTLVKVTADTTVLATCNAGAAGTIVKYKKGAAETEARSICVCEEAAGAFAWTGTSATSDCT